MTPRGASNAAAVAAVAAPRRIVLVGRPNVGKSALFAALTRSFAAVSNYPGTTVEVVRGLATLDGARVRVIDTPGIHSLTPGSTDERVTRDILLEGRDQAVVAVGDAKDVERTLLLAVQLCELDLPFVLCLNMMDEAQSRGIAIDREKLEARLGVGVVPTVATRAVGVEPLQRELRAPSSGLPVVSYPEEIEAAVERLSTLLPPAPISPRALALMTLCADDSLKQWLARRLSAASAATLDEIRRELQARFDEPLPYVIGRARAERARELAGEVVRTRHAPGRGEGRIARSLDRISVHPVWSIPLLAGVLYLSYLFVGVLGAGTLVDLLEGGLFGQWINPAATSLVERLLPAGFFTDLLVGPYGVVTMALTYALALILPIVTTFFIAFGALEDSGYLPRLAVVLNRLFKRMGLNGKAVLPMVLGLGCDTMATLTTRILETRRERLIVIVLLSLAVPCSAQLAVILAMLGALSTVAMGIWLGVIAAVILLVGALAGRLLPGRGSDFVVELPPLRVPRLSNILLKTVARLEWYLKEAVPLFVLGTLVLFLGDRSGLLERLKVAVEPVVSGLLGLPRQSAEAFLIGFLRRDFGAAGLYDMMRAGQLDAGQVVVAAITITLFMPCIAQFFMILKELGWRTALAVTAFVFCFAVGTGALVHQVLRLWPIL